MNGRFRLRVPFICFIIIFVYFYVLFSFYVRDFSLKCLKTPFFIFRLNSCDYVLNMWCGYRCRIWSRNEYSLVWGSSTTVAFTVQPQTAWASIAYLFSIIKLDKKLLLLFTSFFLLSVWFFYNKGTYYTIHIILLTYFCCIHKLKRTGCTYLTNQMKKKQNIKLQS